MIGGPPWQPSSRAVDGNSQTTWTSCIHTQKDVYFQNPWWRVDLGKVEPVNEVYIVNRGDCCGERLNPFEIRVGKKKLHEALLEIINRYKPEKMNRTTFQTERTTNIFIHLMRNLHIYNYWIVILHTLVQKICQLKCPRTGTVPMRASMTTAWPYG